MKVFLSAINDIAVDYFISKGLRMKWNLLSYYQIKNNRKLFDKVLQWSDEVLIDSGAHSFQYGKQVDWDVYTEEYTQFIKEVDCPKIVGYFEMDVDNIIGLPKVLQLRKKLERVSDKIIPVWHNNRGIDGYHKMCEEYAGKIVSITGFRNKEILDKQYLQFLKVAWKNHCRVHCLGMTRKDVLNHVPFDYTDSSSWLQMSVYGQVWNPTKGAYDKPTRESSRVNRKETYLLNYKKGMEDQEYYYRKWIKYENPNNRNI